MISPNKVFVSVSTLALLHRKDILAAPESQQVWISLKFTFQFRTRRWERKTSIMPSRKWTGWVPISKFTAEGAPLKFVQLKTANLQIHETFFKSTFIYTYLLYSLSCSLLFFKILVNNKISKNFILFSLKIDCRGLPLNLGTLRVGKFKWHNKDTYFKTTVDRTELVICGQKGDFCYQRLLKFAI